MTITDLEIEIEALTARLESAEPEEKKALTFQLEEAKIDLQSLKDEEGQEELEDFDLLPEKEDDEEDDFDEDDFDDFTPLDYRGDFYDEENIY